MASLMLSVLLLVCAVIVEAHLDPKLHRPHKLNHKLLDVVNHGPFESSEHPINDYLRMRGHFNPEFGPGALNDGIYSYEPHTNRFERFDPYRFGSYGFNFDNMPLPYGLSSHYPIPYEKDIYEKHNHVTAPAITNKELSAEEHKVDNPEGGEEISEEVAENKDDKPSGSELDAKKDYLLVENDGNNIYLLRENPKLLNILPNNQLNNVVYVPYNQNQNPTVNSQVIPNRQITGSGQVPIVPNQNSGNILIYANGQLIQIPGIVLNQPSNQYGKIQGIIVPNNGLNTQNVLQNPGTNLIYAVPNQGNNQYFVQTPNQVQGNPVVNPVPVNNLGNQAYVVSLPNKIQNANLVPTLGVQVPQNAVFQPAINPSNDVTLDIPPNDLLNTVETPVTTTVIPVESTSVQNVEDKANPSSSVNDATVLPIHPAVMITAYKDSKKKKDEVDDKLKDNKDTVTDKPKTNKDGEKNKEAKE